MSTRQTSYPEFSLGSRSGCMINTLAINADTCEKNNGSRKNEHAEKITVQNHIFWILLYHFEPVRCQRGRVVGNCLKCRYTLIQNSFYRPFKVINGQMDVFLVDLNPFPLQGVTCVSVLTLFLPEKNAPSEKAEHVQIVNPEPKPECLYILQ